MLPSLKKRNKAPAAVPTVPAWHPDLRNVAALPDTKIVRTAFFLNGVAVLAAVSMLLWLSITAYQLRDLRQQIATWEADIERQRRTSDQAIALYRKFQADAKPVEEVSAFVTSRPVTSEILLRLAETLPGYLALDRVDVRETLFTLRGSVRGAADQASGAASAYLELLQGDRFFTDRFDEIKLVSLTRNPQTGRMVVELTMRVKEQKK
jgi:hypothetical protein